MNPTLYLSCVVCIIGSLVWTASAQGDFESERTRVLGIYGNPNVHQVTKIRNIPLAVDFLDKYSDRIEMTPEQRSNVADNLRRYKDEQAQQGIVDGAPPQGGLFGFLGKALLKLIIDIATNEVKKATKIESD